MSCPVGMRVVPFHATMRDTSMIARDSHSFVFLQMKTDCLRCYTCTRTEGEDVQTANIDCLANGTEIQCQPYQDRCYSIVEGDNTVQKGCTRAENCIGNRICCQTDFCNAGFGATLKTGFGQPCEGEPSCMQDEGMTCRRQTTASSQVSHCLCSDRWFPLGAACRPQSGEGGLCFEDSHCLLLNSFCQYQRCQCGDVFFPNYTLGACQLKLPILVNCSDDEQCRASNSVCLQRCVCQIGHIYEAFSGHCSGSLGVLKSAIIEERTRVLASAMVVFFLVFHHLL